MSRARPSGFTLIELALVLAIAALLLALAVPAYRQQALRAARSEALQAIAAATACLERHRAQRGQYAGHGCAGGGGPHYLVSVMLEGTAGDERYRIAAVPQDGQQADACGTLGLDHLAQRSASGVMAVEDCWAGR